MLQVSMSFTFIHLLKYLKAEDRVVTSKNQFSDMIIQHFVTIWLLNIMYILYTYYIPYLTSYLYLKKY